MGSIESAANASEIVLKPSSKKREKAILFEMRKTLISDLSNLTDPTLVLLTVVLILHSHVSGVLIHAPGACINMLLKSISSSLLPEIHAQLISYANLVDFRATGNEEQNEDIVKQNKEALENNLISIREIGLNFKAAFK